MSEQGWTAVYFQNGERYEMMCGSVEAAVEMLLVGECSGALVPHEVLNPDGSILYDDVALEDPSNCDIDMT